MTKKSWNSMTLTEKTQTFNKMRDRFPGKGVTSTEEAKIMRLCEKNIPHNHDAIDRVIKGEISPDDLKLSTPVKPSTETKTRSTSGERSVPEAMRLSDELYSSVSESEQKSWHYFVYA